MKLGVSEETALASAQDDEQEGGPAVLLLDETSHAGDVLLNEAVA
jgi:hypothetical protein